MKLPGYKVLQLTDMHLFADPDEKLLGVNTEESFQSVISLARELSPDPDLLCITGDISQDETMQAYERFANTVNVFSCPKYWVPGNHDDVDFIKKVFGHHHIQREKHMVLDHWQIIMLDSKKPDAVEGYLQDDQFDLLEESLATFPEHHTLIFLHHHPMPVGSQWLDRLMLTNSQRFWEAIKPYQNIKLVICGHVHQEHAAHHHHIDFYSSPSTCFQFMRNSEKFGVESLGPGYRMLELFPDGSYETQVYRVENFEINVSGELKGY